MKLYTWEIYPSRWDVSDIERVTSLLKIKRSWFGKKYSRNFILQIIYNAQTLKTKKKSIDKFRQKIYDKAISWERSQLSDKNAINYYF